MQISSPPAVGDNSKNTFFFDNQARAALRRGIMAAINDDTPLIVLTGPKGSGKTTLISRLVATLPNDIEGMVISQTSYGGRRFDDVLLGICRHIALEPAWRGHPDAEQIKRIQEETHHYLTRNGTRLLLILDQGEETFLAMLERVLKMVNAVNDGAVIIHLLLVGRENLPADLERLRLVHLPEMPERHFTLPLLDDSDLPDFLRQWLAQAKPDIQESTISLRGWQTLYAEAGGRPGHLAALLDERFDTLTLTGGQSERRPDAPDTTGKIKPLAARQKPKMFAGFSLTALAQRLEDALLTPPGGLRSQRPTTGKPGRAASRVMSRRLVNPTRLRRKNILFWGRLYRHMQRLRERITPAMAAISRASAHSLGKAKRGIGQHRSAGLGKTVAARIPVLPPGVLKKFVIVLLAVWLVVIGVAALWQGFSRVPPAEKAKQGETQTLAENANQPPADIGEENILPGEKPAGQAESQARLEEQEIISGPAAGMPTAATAIAPKAAVKAKPRPTVAKKAEKKLKRPAHSREKREPAKITTGKKNKKAAPEAKLKRPAHSQDKREAAKITTDKQKKKAAPKASKPSSKPTHIPRGKTAEKARR